MAEGTITVTRDDHDVCELPCERIPLEYPELSGRAEACVGRTRNSDVWAAVGYNTGGGGAGVEGVERLFCSRDGGRTWTSRLLPPTERGHLGAFTVLRDDSLLLAVGGEDGASIEFYGSNDRGVSWEHLSRLLAEPFERIGEGFLSLTQLRDGMVLFPVCRWQKAPEGTPVEFPQYVFRSSDGGRTWQGEGELGSCQRQTGRDWADRPLAGDGWHIPRLLRDTHPGVAERKIVGGLPLLRLSAAVAQGEG